MRIKRVLAAVLMAASLAVVVAACGSDDSSSGGSGGSSSGGSKLSGTINGAGADVPSSPSTRRWAAPLPGEDRHHRPTTRASAPVAVWRSSGPATVDFGASDASKSDEDIAEAREGLGPGPRPDGAGRGDRLPITLDGWSPA
jgi:hypothetical protein